MYSFDTWLELRFNKINVNIGFNFLHVYSYLEILFLIKIILLLVGSKSINSHYPYVNRRHSLPHFAGTSKTFIQTAAISEKNKFCFFKWTKFIINSMIDKIPLNKIIIFNHERTSVAARVTRGRRCVCASLFVACARRHVHVMIVNHYMMSRRHLHDSYQNCWFTNVLSKLVWLEDCINAFRDRHNAPCVGICYNLATS